MNTLESKQGKKVLKLGLEDSLLNFSRYFFREVLGYRMIVNDHHVLLAETLTKVYNGKIKRLVINMPPGYTKTELAVVNFIAWCLAKNPTCRFIHATYSDMLALENSTKVRDIITSEEYQQLWPMKLRSDSRAKGAWKIKKTGGGMQARAAGGPITGFRAGQPEKGFSGAFIIDDPLKPDDASSIVSVDKINNRFNSVFRSRLMKESETPMIVIMQRISENDPSAYLLNGGMNEKFYHLNLSALIDGKKEQRKHTHSIPIKHNLKDGPLWPWKHNEEQLKELEQADPYTYAAQYDQNPVPLGGGIFKEKWFNYYTLGSIIPEWRFITADTAQKTKEHNDYSVFQLWGCLNGNIYLMDQLRGKWEAPELRSKFISFWNKNISPGATTSKLRFAGIEDKSSGTGLIQEASRSEGKPIPIKAIQRGTDKLVRAMDSVPYVASGHVWLPEDSDFVLDFIAEVTQFTASFTHKNDDQVDAMMDAIDIGLRPSKKSAGTW